jgi:hypothetical protein
MVSSLTAWFLNGRLRSPASGVRAAAKALGLIVAEPFFTFGGYSIKRVYCVKHRRWRTSVRIDRETYRYLKVRSLNAALKVDELTLAERLHSLPFEPYKPIRRQVRALWRAINRVRNTALLEPVPENCLRAKRHLLRPYEDEEPSWRARG